jgi:hypothetical protein
LLPWTSARVTVKYNAAVRRIPLTSLAWATLLAAAVVWAALVLSAPLLGQVTAGGRGPAAVAAGVYLSGRLVCHQRPERSFHLLGAQLPVCGRCTGLYVAAAAGILLALAMRPREKNRPGPRSQPALGGGTNEGVEVAQGARPRVAWSTGLLAASVPSVLTLAFEWSGAWPVSNVIRAAAAAPLGLALGALLVEAAGFRGRL